MAAVRFMVLYRVYGLVQPRQGPIARERCLPVIQCVLTTILC